MSNYASGAKLADLSLASDPPPVAAPPPAAAAPPPAATPPAAPIKPVARDASSRSSDEYLAQAIQEFDAGTIDQPLWLRALDLSGNNQEAAKPAYLRARAAALWVATRNKQLEKPARRTPKSSRGPTEPPVERRQRRRRSKRLTLVVGALGFIAMTGGGLLAMLSSNDAPEMITQDTKPGQSRLPAASKVAPVRVSESERISKLGDDLSKKVGELKASGNWNVLVLYAVEWVRKAPTNGDAWNELSIGYGKLRQFNDALEAATKATQLAPKNSQAWQNLGEINVMLQQPVAALSAYEQAVALNGRDVTSLVQVGLMNAQLGHLPEAKAAFARVLDMNPLDVDALCGAESIAQKEGRPKDADAIARQLKAGDLHCREPAVVVPVVAAAVPAPVSAAKKKPASPTAR